MEIIVAYWSGTGNTQAGADILTNAIKDAGKDVREVNVENFSADELKDCPVFALGCPAMGDEVLEESVMEDFVIAVEGFAAGKKIGLFGSYGWGDGQWMRDWVERMEKAGATVCGGEDAIWCNEPDADAEDKLKALGAQLAAF
jgi:flavodoxin short chain